MDAAIKVVYFPVREAAAIAAKRDGPELMIEYALPGSVLLIKLAYRLAVDQRPGVYDLARAAILFPLDIAFLSLSFGAASIVHANHGGAEVSIHVQFFASVILAFVAGLVGVTVLTKRAEDQFEKVHYIATSILTSVGYITATFLLVCSLNIWRIFQ